MSYVQSTSTKIKITVDSTKTHNTLTTIKKEDYRNNAKNNYHMENGIYGDFGIIHEKSTLGQPPYETLETFSYIDLNNMDLWNEVMEKLLHYYNEYNEHRAVLVILPAEKQIAIIGKNWHTNPLLNIDNSFKNNRLTELGNDKKDIIYFHPDIYPRARNHQLLMPKNYYKNLVSYWYGELDIKNKQNFINTLEKFYEDNKDSHVMITSNIGSGYQSQPHLHMHCIVGSKKSVK